MGIRRIMVEQEIICNTCKGTGTVSDGMGFNRGLTKDCPDCDGLESEEL